MGKVLLAHLPEQRRGELLALMQLTHRGPNTITERSALIEELSRVREAGLAVNNEEMAYGLRSIAAPVRSRSGEVVAAVNLAVHRSMVSLGEMTGSLGPTLCRAVGDLSARIGYQAPMHP